MPENDKSFRMEITKPGNRTIRVEILLSVRAGMEEIPRILTNYSNYHAWVLPGINGGPGDPRYGIEIDELAWSPEDPPAIFLGYRLNIPLFRFAFRFRFLLGPSSSEGAFNLTAELDPDCTRLPVRAKGTFVASPGAPGSGLVAIHMIGEAHLSSWLVYRALPLKLLEREFGRIPIVVANYQREEARLAQRAG